MSFLLKGEYALQQLNDVEILKMTPEILRNYSDLDRLSKNWKKKIVKVDKLGQFCTCVLTNFQLIILDNAPENAIAMIAGNIPFPMRFVCQIPLMHFQKISKAQESNTYLLSFCFPANELVLRFTQPKGVEQAMLFMQRVNDGRFHFTKYFCMAGACEEQCAAAAPKQELPLSEDPLFVQ